MASIFSGKAGRQAGMYAADTLEKSRAQGFGFLDDALSNATGLYGNAQDRFTPLANLTAGGADLYGDSLGINGADGNARATGAFQVSPGYQFGVDQATQAGLRAANAGGMLNSGNAQIALADRAQGMANQEYGGWQDRLSGLTTLGAGIAGQQAGLDTSLATLGAGIAGQKAELGFNAANGIASAGSGALMAGQNAAANRIGFGMNLLSGLTSLGTGLFGGANGAGAFSSTGAFGR